jgi:hypothetical protein
MADSKPVGHFALLETELKCSFERGLLLSSYNIYSQFKPRQMLEAFSILELVALEIAYHAGGGLSNYETTMFTPRTCCKQAPVQSSRWLLRRARGSLFLLFAQLSSARLAGRQNF